MPIVHEHLAPVPAVPVPVILTEEVALELESVLAVRLLKRGLRKVIRDARARGETLEEVSAVFQAVAQSEIDKIKSKDN